MRRRSAHLVDLQEKEKEEGFEDFGGLRKGRFMGVTFMRVSIWGKGEEERGEENGD